MLVGPRGPVSIQDPSTVANEPREHLAAGHDIVAGLGAHVQVDGADEARRALDGCLRSPVGLRRVPGAHAQL
eukprot:704236-Alexandrium_andersonii.AAC.1